MSKLMTEPFGQGDRVLFRTKTGEQRLGVFDAPAGEVEPDRVWVEDAESGWLHLVRWDVVEHVEDDD